MSLLAGGIFALERLADRNEQLAQEVAQAKMQQLQAETGRSAVHLDMARRAWEENDLVGAAIFLNGMAGSSYQSEEQQRLRDLCRSKCRILRGHARAVTSVAVNRAHRLGQKSSVFVSRFISQNTIEGRIAEVLEQKRALFNEMIEGNGAPSTLGLSEDDVFGLFDIQARPHRK